MESYSPTGRAHRRWMCANKVLYRLLIVLGVVNLAVAPNARSECPSPCSCIWTAGKNTAICRAAGYTFIPSLNPEIQMLDVRNNYIRKLREFAFSSTGMVNLQKIYLQNNTLRQIHRNTFNDLNLLIEVDLSFNLLTSIPKGIFSDNARLKSLNLNWNPLKVLVDDQFPPLHHFKTLSLENCELHTIEKKAFYNIPYLDSISLKSNNLTSLNQNVFLPITNLKSLSLDLNPWRCDCDIKDLRNWYLSGKLYTISIECHWPENFKGKFWENLMVSDFSCPPDVYIEDDNVSSRFVGDNITLHCHVSGDPEPKTVWMFNGIPIDASNDTDFEKFLIEVDKKGSGDKYVNLTISDLTEGDSGEYSCEAINILGVAIANTTLVLNGMVPIEYDRRNSNYWFLFSGLVVGALILFILVTSAVTCACMTYSKKARNKHREKAKMNGSKSFYDQEKHLLDMSTSNTEQLSRKSSCERIGHHGSIELLKNSSSASIDRYYSTRYTNKRQARETTAVIPIAAAIPNVQGVYPPPPPEFSNMPQSNTLGNIYISVQLSDDPSVSVERYPDLIDSRHRSASRNTLREKPRKTESTVPFATLPRRQFRPEDPETPSTSIPNLKYDNMGRRVTVGGSSTLSLHRVGLRDNIPTPPPPPSSSRPDYDYVPL